MDTVARRAEMKNVDAALADAGPSKQAELLVAEGLTDADESVRRLASSALGQISAAVGRARAAARLGGEQVNVAPPPPQLRAAVSAALDDELRAIRGNCVNALVLFEPPPAATERLVTRYRLEPDDTMRALLLSHLLRVGLNDERVKQMLITAIEDRNRKVRHQALLGVGRFTPDSALPAIAAGAERDVQDRAAFLTAMANYGKRATPYRGMLERLLATESRPDVKELVRRTLEAVTGRTP